ncbi:hypothetical protein IWZ03DRAFT_370459 [Phyllosticta citriasiana]|uniref:Uncharacterized protein n=1 Tax=Phyllosticta citriasiana TaxID=595635 RepID=A0ABR1KY48_9PEZI
MNRHLLTAWLRLLNPGDQVRAGPCATLASEFDIFASGAGQAFAHAKKKKLVVLHLQDPVCRDCHDVMVRNKGHRPCHIRLASGVGVP